MDDNIALWTITWTITKHICAIRYMDDNMADNIPLRTITWTITYSNIYVLSDIWTITWTIT